MNLLGLEISANSSDFVDRTMKTSFEQSFLEQSFLELFTSNDKKAIQPYDGTATLIGDGYIPSLLSGESLSNSGMIVWQSNQHF